MGAEKGIHVSTYELYDIYIYVCIYTHTYMYAHMSHRHEDIFQFCGTIRTGACPLRGTLKRRRGKEARWKWTP